MPWRHCCCHSRLTIFMFSRRKLCNMLVVLWPFMDDLPLHLTTAEKCPPKQINFPQNVNVLCWYFLILQQFRMTKVALSSIVEGFRISKKNKNALELFKRLAAFNQIWTVWNLHSVGHIKRKVRSRWRATAKPTLINGAFFAPIY